MASSTAFLSSTEKITQQMLSDFFNGRGAGQMIQAI